MIKLKLKKLANWLLPTFCALCRVRTEGSALCTVCLEELPWKKGGCVCCGRDLVSAEHCGQCIQTPPPYHHTICIFHYQTPIDHFVLSLKFAEKLIYAKLLGDLMAVEIKQRYAEKNKPEWIIPVPLHPTRLKERGYNQAVEIARSVSRALQIPIQKHCCTRVLPTLPQASTTADERRKNMKQAFAVDPTFSAKHVAIVDDVLTTGSTVTELAMVLKKAGVGRIDVWCCARTELRF